MSTGRARAARAALRRVILLAATAAAAADAADAQYGGAWRVQMTEASREKGLKGSWTSRGGMPVYVSEPGPLGHARPKTGYPVVIVAHHAVGIYHAAFLREFADDLAAEGYLAVLPDLFHRVWSDSVPNGQDMPFDRMNIPAMLASQDDGQIAADLEGVLELLAASVGLHADTERVVVLGFCMGGRISWLAGVSPVLRRAVRGIVAYHGGNVWKALPPPAEGEAPRPGPGDQLAALGCPALGHFGGEDKNPSPADMERLKEQAERAGKDVEFHLYEGAKHGFSCRDSANYLELAARQSWTRTLAFLSRTIARPGAAQRTDL